MNNADNTTELALKVREAIIKKLSEEERNSGILLDEALWLAMQMICGPYRAANAINQSQVRQ